MVLLTLMQEKKIPPFGIKKPMYDVLKQEEQNAKTDHLNIWQYGELNCDSDDDWNLACH